MLMNNPFVSRVTLISFDAIARLYEKIDIGSDCSLGSESHVSGHKMVRYKNQIHKDKVENYPTGAWRQVQVT